MSSTSLWKRRDASCGITSKDSREDDTAFDDDENENDDKQKSSFYFSSAVRHMAWWRIAFFLIMLMEWNSDSVLTPFGSLDITTNVQMQKSGHDAWFRYEHFAWVQSLHVSLSSTSDGPYLKQIGHVCCFIAAFGKDLPLLSNTIWKVATLSFVILYSIRFWAKATNFTNHNYLFPLLMFWTLLSGGGNLSGQVFYQGKTSTLRDDGACQIAIIALRFQFAVVYGYASLWKMVHEDWWAGRIVEGIFVSFEEQGSSRGIPWKRLSQEYPHLFVMVAFSGLLLDFSMFIVLAFAKPSRATRNWFLAFTLAFHLFTTVAMSNVIGYSFPSTCIAGLILFLPLTQVKDGPDSSGHGDAALGRWLKFYAQELSSKSSRHRPRSLLIVFFLFCAWQFFMPLRMLVVSQGNYPYNRLGYRYSWTMMLHSLDYGIVRHESGQPSTLLLLSYFVPTCFTPDRNDIFMPRSLYFGPGSEHPMQDSRSVPMYQVLSKRESAMLDVFPSHLIAPVGAGVARVIDQSVGPNACTAKLANYNLPASQLRMGMHAVYFGRLNQNGPYCRMVDPTIDLVSVMEQQAKLSYFEVLWNAVWDRRPTEYMLKGIGSMRERSFYYHNKLEEEGWKNVRILTDRAACLSARPIWFRPMKRDYTIKVLELPQNTVVGLLVERSMSIILKPGDSHQIRDVMEFEVLMPVKHQLPACSQSVVEDTLIAIMWN
jgi:hypothetical protein